MSHREFKSMPFELKVLDGGEADGKRLRGHGAAFLNVDAVGDIIAPGAFKADLPAFLADGFVGGLNHDWDQPIARLMDAGEDAKGLWFESTPIVETAHGLDVLKLCAGPNPVIRKMSIGYRVAPGGFKHLGGPDEIKSLWDRHGYTPTEQDGERAAKGVRLLTRLRTLEVSPVTIPANELASMALAKSAAPADFASHSRKVASAAGEFLEGVGAFLGRYESRLQARLKEGRELSAANWQALKDVHDRHTAALGEHSALCDRMAAILDRTKPGDRAKADERPAPPDDATIYTDYYTLLAALG